MKRKVGIICAADDELSPFLPHIEKTTVTRRAMLRFYEGEISGMAVAVVFSGVGRVNAAAAAQIMIDIFGVNTVINAGTAAGMSKDVGLFDIVVSSKTLYHDLAPEILMKYHPWLTTGFFPANETLLNAARLAAQKNTGYRIHFGTTATGEKFIDCEGRDTINAAYSPLSVDMETAGIAHVCHINSLPFIAARAVTDTADHSGKAIFKENCVRASEISKDFVLAVLSELDVEM